MMEAKVKWIKGMQFIGSASSKYKVVMDADPKVGGENSGTRPMALFLIGLGGCTGMDVVSILRKMRIGFDSLEIEIRAEKADEHPKVYKEIELKYVITGTNIPEDKFLRAIELSQERYCSASAMLKKTADFKITHEIIGQDGR